MVIQFSIDRLLFWTTSYVCLVSEPKSQQQPSVGVTTPDHTIAYWNMLWYDQRSQLLPKVAVDFWVHSPSRRMRWSKITVYRCLHQQPTFKGSNVLSLWFSTPSLWFTPLIWRNTGRVTIGCYG